MRVPLLVVASLLPLILGAYGSLVSGSSLLIPDVHEL